LFCCGYDGLRLDIGFVGIFFGLMGKLLILFDLLILLFLPDKARTGNNKSKTGLLRCAQNDDVETNNSNDKSNSRSLRDDKQKDRQRQRRW